MHVLPHLQRCPAQNAQSTIVLSVVCAHTHVCVCRFLGSTCCLRYILCVRQKVVLSGQSAPRHFMVMGWGLHLLAVVGYLSCI
jgi:hypothetical protein